MLVTANIQEVFFVEVLITFTLGCGEEKPSFGGVRIESKGLADSDHDGTFRRFAGAGLPATDVGGVDAAGSAQLVERERGPLTLGSEQLAEPG